MAFPDVMREGAIKVFLSIYEAFIENNFKKEKERRRMVKKHFQM